MSPPSTRGKTIAGGMGCVCLDMITVSDRIAVQVSRGSDVRNLFVLMSGLAVILGLSGCQDQLMSDDRMRSSIAGVLGVPPSSVTLTDRRSDGPTNTHVLAHVAGGKTYACTVNGGGMLALGMMNPPTCQPAAVSS